MSTRTAVMSLLVALCLLAPASAATNEKPPADTKKEAPAETKEKDSAATKGNTPATTKGKAAAPDSGIDVQALIGPKRPSTTPADAKDGDTIPFSTTLIVLAASDNHYVTHFMTGEDGRHKVPLPPGEYIIRSQFKVGQRLPRAPDQRVKVKAKQFAQVTMRFDSGLR